MKRVFLSFASQDREKIEKIIPQLNSPEFELDLYRGPLDTDIDGQEAQAIKRLIGEKIVECSITVCLITENTHLSKWVDLQLQKSRNKGMRIIAMALKGTLDAVLPAIIREENLKFYPWDPVHLKKLIGEDTGKLFNNSF